MVEPGSHQIIENEDEFLNDVVAFYTKRGTPFDRDPKVSGRPIQLHKLYKLVISRGGYDILSGERMQWRSLMKEFNFPSQHEAAMTFQVKTVYYKNLAAYEIHSYWGEQPPPREILEDITAKGGDLRTRTVENFGGGRPGGGEEAQSSEGEHTPRKETELEDPGSASRYPTRQLRLNPQKTQISYPDTGSARRTMRTTLSPQPAPPPTTYYSNASADPRNAAFSIDKYEPKQPNALTLRPVVTPASKFDLFYQQKAMERAQRMPRLPPEPQHFMRHAIPDGMKGPNIYLRCLYGLRSGIKEEQDFALHHLVKVSYERGDKYKFEGFPLLAESLIETALDINNLIYGFNWKISFDEAEGLAPDRTLNATFGSPDLREKMRALKPLVYEADPEDPELTQRLDKLNEAALVMRNMVILEENAIFISKFPLFRDFLTIALNLPEQSRLAEYRYYALEMAEQTTRYWNMRSGDGLYLSLLNLLESNDRAVLLSSLRAINRIGIDTTDTHKLTDVPMSTLHRLMSLVMLAGDDELVENALDFIYEFTAIPENVTTALNNSYDTFSTIVPRLSSLLLHNGIPHEEKIQINRNTTQKLQTPATIPVIPLDLYSHLLTINEPERSSRWLRCCFEESPSNDITQIAIWQAYQGRFQTNNPIPAADFIKNVSNTFTTAQAQVINDPPAAPRFIIKGIRPRRVLVDTTGRPYFKCLWEISRVDPYDPAARSSQRNLCNQWHSSRENMWKHMLLDHLSISRTPDGNFNNEMIGQYTCRYTGCLRASPFTKPLDIAVHLRSHIPATGEEMRDIINEMAGGKDQAPEYIHHKFYYTSTDEKGHPAGIPYMSVMVMRNLARFANKFGAGYESKGLKLMDRLFSTVYLKLWDVISVNRTLRTELNDLIGMIGQAEKIPKHSVLGMERAEDTQVEDDGDTIMV